MQKKENTPAHDEDLFQIPETLLGEFLEPQKEKELLRGLNAMFQTFFATNRYFDDECNNEAVMECYHFCRYFLTHKELFNPQNVA